MKLYLNYFKTHFKSELQYKISFIMSFLSQFLVVFAYLLTITFLFDKFSNIGGYTLYEVLLTFSIVQFGYSFCEVFFRGMDSFEKLIINGGFDRLLIRPRNIILQVFGEEVSFIKISRLIQAIVVLIISIIKVNIKWNLLKIITLIFMLISSIVLILSIFILAASYCFITVKGLEIRNVMTNGGKEIAQYPIGIFNKGIVFILSYIIPFGFVNYYPLLYLLDETRNKLFIISPLVTFIYLIFSILIFYKGVKRYSGVGS